MIGLAIGALAVMQALIFLGLVLLSREVRALRLDRLAADPLAAPYGDAPHVEWRR